MNPRATSKTTRPVAVLLGTTGLFFVLLLSSGLPSRAQAVPNPERMASTTTGQTHPVELLLPQADELGLLNNPPFFPGGPEALETYLQNPALYPLPARQALRQGSVRVRFRVLTTGQLTQLQVVQSGGRLIDKAALRVVAGMPRWSPAHRDGAVVSCLYELPITFRLD